MSVQTVRRRLRLRSLDPALRDAFQAGRITLSVAEAAARLRKDQQQTLARRLGQGARLTLSEVRDASRQQSAELPAELFGERALAWHATARAHLIAALHAIPDARRDEPVARLVARAVSEIEHS